MKYEIDVSEIRQMVLEQLTYEYSRIRNAAAIWQIAAYVSAELSDRIYPTNQIPEDVTWISLIENAFYTAYEENRPKYGIPDISNEGISPMYNMAADVEEKLWSYRYAPILKFSVNKFNQPEAISLRITE